MPARNTFTGDTEMKPNIDRIEEYKEMAKTSPDSMKAKVEANLKATCDKYAGHEDRLDDCIEYLTDCAKEILNGHHGEVDNETCYRICRDYFNDEIWKKEDEEEAKKKAEREKIKAKRKVKVKKKTEALKNEPDKKFEKCSKCKKDFLHLWKDGLCLKCFEKKEKADAEAAEKARKKAEAEEARKKALEEKKSALEAKRAAKEAEKARKKEAEKAVPGQLDMFAMLGV